MPLDRKAPRLENSQDPAVSAATVTDARAWMKILARYRQPSTGRGIVEIAITVVPLAALWVLAWATLDIGSWLAWALAIAAAWSPGGPFALLTSSRGARSSATWAGCTRR